MKLRRATCILPLPKKARSEGHRNIAHLFTALGTSDSIHARNFKNILADLGVNVKEAPRLDANVSRTKENLGYATSVELTEINERYPACIEKVKPENHNLAVQYIIYAGKGKKQHQELIRQIQSATEVFFGALARRFKKTPGKFFVCAGCGSTLTELPRNRCPICCGTPLGYKVVERATEGK